MRGRQQPLRNATLPERRVVIEGADYLVRVMLPEMARSAEGLYDSAGDSVHECGCAALGALGLLDPGSHGALWQDRFGPDSLRPHVESRADLTDAHLDAVLQAFVDHAAGKARSLPDTRAAFALPRPHLRIGGALVRAGFLSQEAGMVRWTPRIAPYMQQAILWDGKGQCLSEIWVAQEEAEARQFLASLPERLCSDLRRTVVQDSGLAGIDLLRRHWTPSGWTDMRQARPGDLADSGFRVEVFTTIVRMMREGRA